MTKDVAHLKIISLLLLEASGQIFWVLFLVLLFIAFKLTIHFSSVFGCSFLAKFYIHSNLIGSPFMHQAGCINFT